MHLALAREGTWRRPGTPVNAAVGCCWAYCHWWKFAAIKPIVQIAQSTLHDRLVVAERDRSRASGGTMSERHRSNGSPHHTEPFHHNQIRRDFIRVLGSLALDAPLAHTRSRD